MGLGFGTVAEATPNKVRGGMGLGFRTVAEATLHRVREVWVHCFVPNKHIGTPVRTAVGAFITAATIFIAEVLDTSIHHNIFILCS